MIIELFKIIIDNFPQNQKEYNLYQLKYTNLLIKKIDNNLERFNLKREIANKLYHQKNLILLILWCKMTSTTIEPAILYKIIHNRDLNFVKAIRIGLLTPSISIQQLAYVYMRLKDVDFCYKERLI